MEFAIDMGEIIRSSKSKLLQFQDTAREDLICERDQLKAVFEESSALEIADMQSQIARYAVINRKLNGLDFDPIQLFQVVMSEVNRQAVFALHDVLKLQDGRITATNTFEVDGPLIECKVAMHKRNRDFCVTLPDSW